MPTITLTFADGERVRIVNRSGETILKAAHRAGIKLSSDCEVGDCQTCRATCVGGEVEYDELATVSLTQDELDAGETLPCVAMAATDVELRLSYERGRLIAAKPFAVKIERISRLNASVVGLTARILSPAPLKFLPGQYANLQVPGTAEWRSYSMANEPGEQRVLEFFVRLLKDGAMSRYLTERALPGDIVACSGPQGTFYLREGTRRVLMVAGGTGVAPMVSMLRQMIRSQQSRAVTLCFGVNETTDLFHVDELGALAKWLPHFDLHIAVARGPSSRVYHSGLVTDLIGEDGLAGTDVYLCGPPAMIDCARTIVVNRGAAACSIFSERFLPSAQDDSDVVKDELVEQ